MVSAESIYQPPPVEKVKPVEKNKKEKAKIKRKNKKAKRKKELRQKRHPDNTEKKEFGFSFLMVLFLVMILAGSFLFGILGHFAFPIWLIGLVMMFIGNLGPWFTVFVASLRKKVESQVDGLGFGITLIFLFVFDFFIGCSFLIGGLIIGSSLGWAVGIIFLVLFAIIAAIFFQSIFGR